MPTSSLQASRPCISRPRRWAALLLAAAFTLLAGCATLPPPAGRTPTASIPASAATELGASAARAVARGGAAADTSGFLAMPLASVALDARITLIRRARASLDLQYYLLGNDEVGHRLLGELADAARRGVRVRLLLDDFYTAG